jgi:hypothetical protein
MVVRPMIFPNMTEESLSMIPKGKYSIPHTQISKQKFNE